MGWKSPHHQLKEPLLRGVFGSLEKYLATLANTPNALPVGACSPWLGTTAPTNWVLMYGQTIASAQTLYPALWTNIATTWRSGSSLLVPDLRGRVPVALDNMGGVDAGRLAAANTMGGTGGAETHTLTTAQMPAHQHGTGSTTFGAGFIDFGPGGLGTLSQTDSQGGGGAHNNMQPYILLNWILKLL